MDDGIAVAYIGQEFVAQTLPFRGTTDETGDVDNLDSGRNDRSRALNFHQFGEALVGNGDNTHIRLYRTKREISALRFGVTKTVKKG
jgi:hypothetical protein